MTRRPLYLIAAAVVAIVSGAFLVRQYDVAPSHRAGVDSAATRTSAGEFRPSAAGSTASTSTHKQPRVAGAPPRLPESNRPLAERLDEIERQARSGDPDIGYALALELMHCLELDGHYAETANELDTHPERTDSIARQIDALDEQREHCKGITSDQMRGFSDWIELAARRGSVRAQIDYPTLAGQLLSSPDHALDTAWIDNYKANSLQFLQSAADGGSVDALNQLAHTYADGIMVPKDITMAYAYAFAVSQTGLVVTTPKLLDFWAQGMTPEQIEAARAEGAKIFARCCT
jgi:TPR repeat protein